MRITTRVKDAILALLGYSTYSGYYVTVHRQNLDLAASTPPVSFSGAKAVLPGWHLQSTLHAEDNMTALSLPDYNVSSWYRVSSRATLMAGLIENGVYNDTELFYSNNLQTVIEDRSVFYSPWLYREEFVLGKPEQGQHFFLNTHGITAEADIFVNGALVASREVQQGSFGGHKYEITQFLWEGKNCVLIKAYPANYLRDLVMGFADWNPYPPDNGTGVWRDVELLQSGAVSLSPPRVVTTITRLDAANVTVKMEISNNEHETVSGTVAGLIWSEDRKQTFPLFQEFTLQAYEFRTVAITVQLDKPRIWWPASWGPQNLYTVQLNATVNSALSDISSPRNFGIRSITSHLNTHNDRAFTVNGYPFLVLGAGYSPDMFMRFDENRVRRIFQYMLDMGLNTVRLEGKLEHPELYDLADRMGLMVMAGWECCDKWEGFDYNNDNKAIKWTEHDYAIANFSMLHEAMQMQTHPSILAFLVGSDYWPNDTATQIFLSALYKMDWQTPVIASASQRGFSKLLGDSGMKMVGPYDWIPPNYWYLDEDDAEGGAFGFGSELGAGVGTPELRSLRKFLSEQDLEDLWSKPVNGLFHMSNDDSMFWRRVFFNAGLFGRYGEPTGLEDYVRKAQVMDYEATRAQFEAFSVRQSAERPATGMIYWMLNSAWPNLHWQLFDYYLNPGGAYFGTKVGCRTEHVAYDYSSQEIYIINHSSVAARPNRTVTIDIIDTDGELVFHNQISVGTKPLSSSPIVKIPEIDRDVVFMKLVLQDPTHQNVTLSRNVYWLSADEDVLDSDQASWVSVPLSEYADYTSLMELESVSVSADVEMTTVNTDNGGISAVISLENESDSVPAFFVKMVLLNARTKEEVLPVFWEDNYLTLWPGETVNVTVSWEREVTPGIEGKGEGETGFVVDVVGWNVERETVEVEVDS